MRHIKLFEDWGDTINRRGAKIILIEKNHYLCQERLKGTFMNLEEAMWSFLKHFKSFIEKEWDGEPKWYFSEWNRDVQNVSSWEDFFHQFSQEDIGESTFYLEIFNPDGTTSEIISEVDILSKIYESQPSYLKAFLPFV